MEVGGRGGLAGASIANAGFSFSTASLTFRYDDATAAALRLNEESLRSRQYTDGHWLNMPSVVNSAARTITTGPVTAFSLFAVDGFLPKGTLISLR